MSNIVVTIIFTYLSLCSVLLSQEILNHFLSISNRVISFVLFGSLTNTNVFSIWYFAQKLQLNSKSIGMYASQARIEKLFMKNEISQKVNKIYLWLGTHSYYPHTHTQRVECVCVCACVTWEHDKRSLTNVDVIYQNPWLRFVIVQSLHRIIRCQIDRFVFFIFENKLLEMCVYVEKNISLSQVKCRQTIKKQMWQQSNRHAIIVQFVSYLWVFHRMSHKYTQKETHGERKSQKSNISWRIKELLNAIS